MPIIYCLAQTYHMGLRSRLVALPSGQPLCGAYTSPGSCAWPSTHPDNLHCLVVHACVLAPALIRPPCQSLRVGGALTCAGPYAWWFTDPDNLCRLAQGGAAMAGNGNGSNGARVLSRSTSQLNWGRDLDLLVHAHGAGGAAALSRCGGHYSTCVSPCMGSS